MMLVIPGHGLGHSVSRTDGQGVGLSRKIQDSWLLCRGGLTIWKLGHCLRARGQ
ncbi:unnamed protein product [Staurois parvus]|uniref:Uncharacterized protein n=1 Tax=Staurois parvus TaxID=386267 RepID=A0ABN9EAG9_9NEOB|nr:unnamed protein product [Staurois parvus]